MRLRRRRVPRSRSRPLLSRLLGAGHAAECTGSCCAVGELGALSPLATAMRRVARRASLTVCCRRWQCRRSRASCRSAGSKCPQKRWPRAQRGRRASARWVMPWPGVCSARRLPRWRWRTSTRECAAPNALWLGGAAHMLARTCGAGVAAAGRGGARRDQSAHAFRQQSALPVCNLGAIAYLTPLHIRRSSVWRWHCRLCPALPLNCALSAWTAWCACGGRCFAAAASHAVRVAYTAAAGGAATVTDASRLGQGAAGGRRQCRSFCCALRRLKVVTLRCPGCPASTRCCPAHTSSGSVGNTRCGLASNRACVHGALLRQDAAAVLETVRAELGSVEEQRQVAEAELRGAIELCVSLASLCRLPP